VLLAPLIFDKTREVLEGHIIRPSILHGNLSPRRAGAVKMQRNNQVSEYKSTNTDAAAGTKVQILTKRNNQDITHVYLTGPSSFYGDSEFDMAFEDWPVRTLLALLGHKYKY
jgi:hypothetical protein